MRRLAVLVPGALPPLFRTNGVEIEQAHRPELDQVCFERIRRSIGQIAYRHPGADAITILCCEATWNRSCPPQIRVFAMVVGPLGSSGPGMAATGEKEE